jgi:hypothetical protein
LRTTPARSETILYLNFFNGCDFCAINKMMGAGGSWEGQLVFSLRHPQDGASAYFRFPT